MAENRLWYYIAGEELMRKDDLVDLLVKKKEATDKLKRELVLNDLLAFNKLVLRVEEGKDEANSHRVPLKEFHKELCEFVQHGKKKKKLITVPRGHLKSTLITVGYTLQTVAKDPTKRILIANATAAMAEAFLGQIKRHLKSNETFREMFGELDAEADKWTDSMLRFGSEDAYKTKEANVTAYGLGGNLVSQHYDMIIFDDPHNRDNINTKDQIEKVKLAYKDALDLLEPGGDIIVIGTRWHYDDLYGWLQDPDNPGARGFSVFNRQAVADAVIEKQPKGSYKITQGEVLWPEKYSKKTLTHLLNDKGLYEFSCQYQNVPIDEELAVFKRDWFREYDHTELKTRKMLKFTAIDPAISLKERADYTAIVTVGMDIWENIYILEIKRGRYSEKQMVDELIFTKEKWSPVLMAIETVAFQKTLQNFIMDETKKRGARLPIIEVKPESNESKEKRIRSLQPYYMRGNIYHNRSLAQIEYLEDELIRFPKGKNDDIVDALAYAVSISYPPKNKEKSSSKKRYLY